MVRTTISTVLAIAAAVAVTAGLSATAAAQSAESGGRLLLLVNETVERPGEGGVTTRYWWQDPADPQWTETDRILTSELREVPGQVVEPTGETRISKIYRRPELSLDNAASLASLLGARRVVVGNVRYEYSNATDLPGLRAVHVDATLQLVDAASAEPKVLRSFETSRSMFGAGDLEKLGERARKDVAGRAADLLGRVLTAASGRVGVESSEPVLAFHDLRRGAALDRIRTFVAELDEVDEFRVRWASEGLVAFVVNPGAEDSQEALEYVTKAVAEHQFDRMRVTRRELSGDSGAYEFDVELSEDFGEGKTDREEDGDGAE